ncbi:MAG: hypothetical protein HZC41_11395 [Chloroflexi bacterium]|nr:hypothetical protein [Chloroflexota bacterium]
MAEEKRTRRPQSKGKCVYCDATYAKAGMSKHLQSCNQRLQVIRQAEAGSKARPKKWLHLMASCEYAPDYWLHLEMDAAKQLRDLDQFLRDIWLECCGHLSAFRIEGQTYSISPMSEYGDRSMAVALGKVLQPEMMFRHEYDFGTTTELVLKVVGEREGMSADKNRWFTIMARNDPPQIVCENCGQKPATQVCTVCLWNEAGAWVCDDCKIKHRCYVEEQDDYMFLPVVNSPRVGMCGYTGSEIFP